jgi:V/A-type H+-transporting ATPase subunit I
MAKMPMQKVEIIAMASDRKSILERLQRRGVLELCDIEDEKLVKVNTASSVANFERNLSVAESALDNLDYYAKEKKSLLSGLNGRTPMSTDTFAKKKQDNDKTMSMCYEINDNVRKIDESKNSISRLVTQIDILRVWSDLDVPQNYKGTKFTKTFIGTIPDIKDEAELYNKISESVQNADYVIQIVSLQKSQICVAITCHNDCADAVYSAIREIGFASLQASSKLTPAKETEKLNGEIDSLNQEIERCKKEIIKFGGKQDDVKFVCDFLKMRMDKYKALGELAMTEKTVVISGYVPKRFVPGLIKEFESKYTVAISVREPGEDDDVPVLLHNDKFSEPVEGITEMYALPNKRDVDPSAVMAFFYYLFFGMMLSDAGYGLIMLIATSIILKKTTVEGNLRRSLVMFRNCGISTVFWGILFGSWFGDLPQIIASNFFGKTITTTALWFQPLDDPIKLLLFSFGLGICHLFLGLGVNFYKLWKEGNKKDAIFDVIPVYLTVLGVAPIATNILSPVNSTLITIGKYMALVGVVAIILTSGRSSKNIFMRFFGGIYGLYNIATGYLSDILSYSRLLALGLATGSIASVINLIATMPSNHVVKVIMLIVVGTAGHTANIAVNLLGAYVHSDRLQFVELFSKFYEGGGRAFAPLKVNTKYIKLDKENIYE